MHVSFCAICICVRIWKLFFSSIFSKKFLLKSNEAMIVAVDNFVPSELSSVNDIRDREL